MRVLIAGLGQMGLNHRRVLKGLGHEVVTVDPVGGCDYLSVKPALTRHPDAAVIAVPTPVLADVAVEVLSHGVPTLVEKPLASSTALARWVEDTAFGADTYCQVGYVERYNPALPYLMGKVDELGGAQLIHTVRVGPDRLNADIRLDLLTHDIDLAHRIAPSANHFPVVAPHRHKLRQVTCHCQDGIVSADLIGRTVDGVEHDGLEPLAGQWRAFEAQCGRGFQTLTGEIGVLDQALRHQGHPVEVAAA